MTCVRGAATDMILCAGACICVCIWWALPHVLFHIMFMDMCIHLVGRCFYERIIESRYRNHIHDPKTNKQTNQTSKTKAICGSLSNSELQKNQTPKKQYKAVLPEIALLFVARQLVASASVGVCVYILASNVSVPSCERV